MINAFFIFLLVTNQSISTNVSYALNLSRMCENLICQFRNRCRRCIPYISITILPSTFKPCLLESSCNKIKLLLGFLQLLQIAESSNPFCRRELSIILFPKHGRLDAWLLGDDSPSSVNARFPVNTPSCSLALKGQFLFCQEIC